MLNGSVIILIPYGDVVTAFNTIDFICLPGFEKLVYQQLQFRPLFIHGMISVKSDFNVWLIVKGSKF